MQTLSRKDQMLVSLLLFSTLFGAGNLIFPPYLGHNAGENFGISLIGFILSDIGIFILGIIAVAKAGSMEVLLNRVNKKFALIFPFVIFICIGPGLAVPRNGSLAFEMGVKQFLPESMASSPLPLFIYTVVFFGAVYWFSMSPSKLVSRFGKVLTPILLILIGMVFVRSLFVPLDTPGAGQGSYANNPMIQGFLDGYLTMDGLAAFVVAAIIINTLRMKGITEEKSITKYMIYTGMGAGLVLGIVYTILAYLGATTATLQNLENGAQVLIYLTEQLFGSYGSIVLALIFTVACFCVAISLVIACSQFFTKHIPSISYKLWVLILCVVSGAVANVGLTQIIAICGPILGAIFPVFMALITLGIFHRHIYAFTYIYPVTVLGVTVFSAIDLANQTILNGSFTRMLSFIPLYAEGLGFIIPAIILGIIGCFMGKKSVVILNEEKHLIS